MIAFLVKIGQKKQVSIGHRMFCIHVLLFLTCAFFPLLLLTGCLNTPSNQNNTPRFHITVAGKLGVEAELLTKMYTLLLRHAGFFVDERPDFGDNKKVFNAILKGEIDIYPEFTGDGLVQVGLSTTGDLQKDFQNIKDAYNKQYHITWLDIALLNDTYGICTSKAIADQFNLENISQLKQLSITTIAATPDSINDITVLPNIEKVYNLHFDASTQIENEVDTFQEVLQGRAQLNICYTTDPLIHKNNFILLEDDKHAFLNYNPAPIIRNDTLHKFPQIAAILNVLAPKLTIDVSEMLQEQVAAKFSIEDVASTWLKSQNLL